MHWMPKDLILTLSNRGMRLGFFSENHLSVHIIQLHSTTEISLNDFSVHIGQMIRQCHKTKRLMGDSICHERNAKLNLSSKSKCDMGIIVVKTLRWV